MKFGRNSTTEKSAHLVDLSFPSLLNVHEDLIGVHGAPQRGIDRCQRRFFFPERTQHGSGTDGQYPCRIAHTTGVEAHINDWLLHLKQPSLRAVLKEKAPRAPRCIVAQVALCAAARLAAFDDLIAVTVWTSH